jgi:hypothetical protein
MKTKVMRTIPVKRGNNSLSRAIKMAESENVVLRTPDGREFVLAELDDFDRELELMRQNKELMAFIDKRFKEKAKYTMAEVRKMLKLDE